jgi:Flp pilus assembly protein TadG
MQRAVRRRGTAGAAGHDIRRAGERGSASVEFALVLPLVLLMCLALLKVGLLVKDQLVVQGAARAGAREGAVSVDDAEVRQSVVDAAVDIDPGLLDVLVAREGGTGTAVTVTVTYHAPVVVPLVSWLFPATIDLSAQAVMRQETDG